MAESLPQKEAFDFIKYRRQLAQELLAERDPEKRREILKKAQETTEYRVALELRLRKLFENLPFRDQDYFDPTLDRKIRIRRLEYPPPIRRILKRGAENEIELDLVNQFLYVATEGRYPSHFTLNHLGGAFTGILPHPYDQIEGWIYVSSSFNPFFECTLLLGKKEISRRRFSEEGIGRLRLFIIGTRNPRFKEFIEEVRESAEELGEEESEDLPPLLISASELVKYINENPRAKIRYSERYCFERERFPERFKLLTGQPYIFLTPYPFFMETKINQKGDRGGLEILSVLYSGLPIGGLGDVGAMLIINDKKPPVQFKDVGQLRPYKSFNYRWGDLCEMMIDLDEQLIIFFYG